MFKTRLVTSIALLAVIGSSLAIFDGVLFRFIMGFAIICAFAEIGFNKTPFRVIDFKADLLGSAEIIFLLGGFVFFCFIASIRACIIVLVSVCAADTAAYIFGKTFGGKLISKRPFPKTSPKKSWEGIIAAVVGSVCSVFVIIYIMDGFSFAKMQSYEYIYLSCGVLAIIGDYLESTFKRSIYVKDSIDLVSKNNKVLLFFENALGGKEGHGGYLDRLDSTTFTGTILCLFFVACKL